MRVRNWPGKRYMSLATFSTLVCLILFVIFAIKGEVFKKTGQEPSFIGANIFKSNPTSITAKYPIDIYPAPWLIAIIWPSVLFWNLCGILYLFYRSYFTKTRFNLNKNFYLLWTLNWTGTILWTFYFDYEDHVTCAIVVGMVTLTAYVMHYIACKAFNSQKEFLATEDVKNGGMRHPFRYLVVEGLGILSMWSSVAFSISVAYLLAYKNGGSMTTAESRELLTADESGTLGITYVIIMLSLWVMFDMMFFGKFSDCSRIIYPTLSLTMFGLTLSNYNSEKGLSLNNLLCILVGMCAGVITLTRRKMKSSLQKLSPNKQPCPKHHVD